MTRTRHYILITFFSISIIFVFGFLLFRGLSFYRTPLDQRFFHQDYEFFKPSGIIGHGLGIAGTLLIIIGISSYMLRKRWRALNRFGLIKNWLEFHIFLCTLGPVLVLYHTSFKFGGVVSISFWSMTAVFLSGIIGRFIYLQIPRSREGRVLSLSEVRSLKDDLNAELSNITDFDEEIQTQLLSLNISPIINEEKLLVKLRRNYKDSLKNIKTLYLEQKIRKEDMNRIKKIIRKEYTLNRKIARLNKMQNLFKYWHVIHLPFALVMLIIMLIHVVITMSLGYTWIVQ